MYIKTYLLGEFTVNQGTKPLGKSLWGKTGKWEEGERERERVSKLAHRQRGETKMSVFYGEKPLGEGKPWAESWE